MTHRGPFQPQPFCDSVAGQCRRERAPQWGPGWWERGSGSTAPPLPTGHTIAPVPAASPAAPKPVRPPKVAIG